LRACRADDERAVQRKAGCTLEPTCEEYQACSEGRPTGGSSPRGSSPPEVSPADLARMLEDCKFGGAGRNAPLTCDEVFSRSFDAMSAEVTTLRDAGGDALARCYDFTSLGQRMSAAHQLQAEALCKESEAGRRAREALDEAGRNLRDDVLEVPFQCGLAVEDLEILTSEWARAKLAEVHRTCHIELGKKILPVVVKKMKHCDYQVELVYKAVKKFGLQDPELDPWIVKAERKCK
jgi:hypothetical protein